MATILNPFLRADDANGNPVSGGQLAVFEAGTTTPVTTYSDRALTTAQAQPLIANSAGEFEQSFVASGIYKIRVSDASGVTLYENDNVRISDRPDDPIFFDTEADALASSDTYATGTLIILLIGGGVLEAAASGATDHDVTNDAGTQKFYRKNKVYANPTAFLASAEGTRGVGSVWLTAEGISYREAASGATDHYVTNAGGVKFYVVIVGQGLPVRAFGAVGDNSTDDIQAFRDAIEIGHSTGMPVVGRSGDNYRVSAGTWWGKDVPGQAKTWWISNGSYIVGDFNNGGAVVDLTGIQNAFRYKWDIRVTTATGKTPTYGILMARPKQASGVVSSGNSNLYAYVFGNFLASAFASISSESNTIDGCYFHNNLGMAGFWDSEDWWKSKFRLPVSGISGTFTIGETITGGGASAKVIAVDPPRNIMLCEQISGTFANNATITGGTSGATATTAIPNGYFVIGDASPNTALGIELGTTSTWQRVNNNLFTNGSTDNLVPCTAINGFNDVLHFACEYNVPNNTNNDLMGVWGDTAGLTLIHPYMHSTHRYSIAMGDASNSADQNITQFKLIPNYAGLTTDRIKALDARVKIFDMQVTVVGELNLDAAPMQGANEITLISRAGTGGVAAFTASGIIEGLLICDPDTVFNITTNDVNNRLTIHWPELGFYSRPRRDVEVIASGAITATRTTLLVDTEAAAATDNLETINLPANVVPHGQEIYLRALTGSRIATVVRTGNIRGTADVPLTATTELRLRYDATVSLWYIDQ